MCTNPLKGWKHGETRNGKDNYIITNYSVDHIEITKSDGIIEAYDEFVSDNCKKPIFSYIEIPCGKCLQCRLDYAKQWADRCMLEASTHEKNCFITLTYDDLNIPVTDDAVNPITGEIQKYKTLRKRDLQLFMKRLRKELAKDDIKCRFFASGEYGSVSLRPHYHLILFGWSPDFEDPIQCIPVGANSSGDKYYSSALIEKCWNYGMNTVTPCTWETCNYVARYVVKKYLNEINGYTDTGIEKEFLTMSNRPGIGLNWYSSHNVCYATFLNQYLGSENGSLRISHNRYFDSKLEQSYPKLFEEIKERRKHFTQEKKKQIYYKSDLPYLQQKAVEAAALEKRTKILKGQKI